ncbi:MAG: prolyl-tRNA synthetase associated domain-containing protein [Proteobacteria bacterium]|jgi:Ala-tRNA(Pro) deacylase|nr:prolyl-tRNA synthetase associated domain-containing protein [Alphaproteobacteria bacterium]NCC03666.1 prolyl-tRNA synthetase associated domain-containing protein [Pseudomonadota bacterium]
MPATEADLFALFEQLGIKTETVEHPPLFTVEDGLGVRDSIPGMDCKNLFLKDKKGKIWLVVMPGDKRAQLSKLEKDIGAARLSFGKPELLMEILGVTPGTVTPFALMNDKGHNINVVLDSDMMAEETINFHPLRNTASTALKSADLMRFINHLGYTPALANCGIWLRGESN